MRNKTWKQVLKYLKPDWHISRYTEQKAVLAFEFGIVVSDCALQLNIPMSREIVERAEKILTEQLNVQTAEEFALNMNVLVLAVLEPKD